MPSTSLSDSSVFKNLDIHKIAAETKLVQRNSSKFCPSLFIQALLEGVIKGEASLSELAEGLGRLVGDEMSKQGLQNRFSDASSDFLYDVFSCLLKKKFVTESAHLKCLVFQRILIEDSSFNRIHKGNSQLFPGHGNGVTDTAGFKVDLAYDLISCIIELSSFHDGTEQDKTIGKDLIDSVRENDLVLRDMGYFNISEFIRIEEVGAYWLSRLPAYTNVKIKGSKSALSLEETLKKTKKSTKKLDLEIYLGEGMHSCRLVAVRADKDTVKKHRAYRKKRSKRTHSELVKSQGWIRDEWHILVTNVNKDEAKLNDLVKLYRMRWDVEIQFRAWKQSLNIEKALNRDSSEHHLFALIMASMIHLVMTMIARQITQKQLKLGELSLENLANSLAGFISKARSFEECWDFSPNLRRVKKDKRKRNKAVIQVFQDLV